MNLLGISAKDATIFNDQDHGLECELVIQYVQIYGNHAKHTT